MIACPTGCCTSTSTPFIASVEVLRDPALAGRPVVVGGRGDPTERGVVSTASYEAREYGVGSGMPLRTAARKCPDAVFLPVDAPAYDEASPQVMDTLRSFDVPVEVLGWDEAFLAVTTDDPEAFAEGAAGRRCSSATGLHASVGIGDNKVRAKIATDFGKPRGTYRLTEENWFEVMGERPTDALWGIGRKTAARLAGLGITTVARARRHRRAGARRRHRSAHGPVVPPARPWRGHLAGRPDPLRAARARPGDHLPAEPHRLGRRSPPRPGGSPRQVLGDVRPRAGGRSGSG